MPLKRLDKARASLPVGYQYGDAEYGVLGNYECCAKFISPHPHRAIISTEHVGEQMFIVGDVYVVTENGALKAIGELR